MHRNPGDEALRRLVRQFQASPDPELAERLALALLRAGVIPEASRTYYGQTAQASERVARSYTAVLPGGPALCLVPINREILHVQIAPSGEPNYHWQRSESGEREEAPLEASASHHMYGHGDEAEPWPGLAVSSPPYGSNRNQSYRQQYHPCLGEFPPYYHQTSPKARQWPVAGQATVHVDPETRSVRILQMRLQFVGGRQPPNYSQRIRQLQGRLRPRLGQFLSEWVLQNPEAFNLAEENVGATEVARALKQVEVAHRRVREEIDRLRTQQQALANTLSSALRVIRSL